MPDTPAPCYYAAKMQGGRVQAFPTEIHEKIHTHCEEQSNRTTMHRVIMQ